MKLDGQIQNAVIGIAFLVIFVPGNIWLQGRWNPRPPPDRYRKDDGLFVTFWNLFDESKFTPEAIEYHRRALRAMPLTVLAFAVGWVVLDSIW